MPRHPVGRDYTVDDLEQIAADLKSAAILAASSVKLIRMKEMETAFLPLKNIQAARTFVSAMGTVAIGNRVKLRPSTVQDDDGSEEFEIEAMN